MRRFYLPRTEREAVNIAEGIESLDILVVPVGRKVLGNRRNFFGGVRGTSHTLVIPVIARERLS